MRLKQKLLVFLSVLMVLVLVACGKSETSSSEDDAGNKGKAKYKIGVALPIFNEFRSYILEAMEEEAKKHPEFEFVYLNAENDSMKQLNQIQNLISQKVDGIILNAVDTTAAADLVSKIKEAGIPVVVVNETFEGIEKADAYVGSKSIQSGIIQMEEVAKQLDGKGNVAIMNGTMGHEPQIRRTEGNKQVISKYPDMKVVLEGSAQWDRAKGRELMENWLNSGKKIDAVVANNDEMAIGAIMALDEANKNDEVLVAGIDATPAALEYVQSGKLEVTVFQDAHAQGVESIKTIVKAVKGESVDDVIIPYQLVTKENVEEYVAKYK
ncbi:sugar ABC transporter substrate-binding protein [Aeribacillus pallidus]|nr:sugar ABC transporter substrate-binding protein [Aeribacillus pallidus]